MPPFDKTCLYLSPATLGVWYYCTSGEVYSAYFSADIVNI
jgi:hypothetical protein